MGGRSKGENKRKGNKNRLRKVNSNWKRVKRMKRTQPVAREKADSHHTLVIYYY